MSFGSLPASAYHGHNCRAIRFWLAQRVVGAPISRLEQIRTLMRGEETKALDVFVEPARRNCRSRPEAGCSARFSDQREGIVMAQLLDFVMSSARFGPSCPEPTPVRKQLCSVNHKDRSSGTFGPPDVIFSKRFPPPSSDNHSIPTQPERSIVAD